MTATNGWPGKPGVPINPEKDGWHWLLQVNGQYPEVWEWASGPAEYGAWCESQGDGQPKEIAKWFHYLGPVLKPDEVQNLRDDLASVERERAHQHGRADRSAAEHAREQAKREALQKRVADLEGALKINFHKHVQGASAADVVITRILPYSVSDVELKKLAGGKDE